MSIISCFCFTTNCAVSNFIERKIHLFSMKSVGFVICAAVLMISLLLITLSTLRTSRNEVDFVRRINVFVSTIRLNLALSWTLQFAIYTILLSSNVASCHRRGLGGDTRNGIDLHASQHPRRVISLCHVSVVYWINRIQQLHLRSGNVHHNHPCLDHNEEMEDDSRLQIRTCICF